MLFKCHCKRNDAITTANRLNFKIAFNRLFVLNWEMDTTQIAITWHTLPRHFFEEINYSTQKMKLLKSTYPVIRAVSFFCEQKVNCSNNICLNHNYSNLYCSTYVVYSDRPKPKFEPKPKVPKFRLVWAEAETES